MVYIKFLWWLLCAVFLFWSFVPTYGLTDVYTREKQIGIDLFYESDSLEYTPPTRFKPTSLSSASTDANYRIHTVLPFEQDRYEDIYLVIPQLGLVAPVVDIPEWSVDHANMSSGREIWINKYLEWWIIEYVSSADPWHRWKRIDFGHSNFYKSDSGRYKSIFANLMALDPNDQVWYFVRNASWAYDLHRYVVTASYHTNPNNVGILKRDWEGADAMIFGCTHGLDGRRIIEATSMAAPIGKPIPYVDPYANLNQNHKSRVDNAIRKINRLRPNLKSYSIIQLVKKLDVLRTKNLTASQKLLIDYIEEKLVIIFPVDNA